MRDTFTAVETPRHTPAERADSRGNKGERCEIQERNNLSGQDGAYQTATQYMESVPRRKTSEISNTDYGESVRDIWNNLRISSNLIRVMFSMTNRFMKLTC